MSRHVFPILTYDKTLNFVLNILWTIDINISNDPHQENYQ